MKGPLTRMEMDGAGCGSPGCGHDHSELFLHPVCHPSGGRRVLCRSCRADVTG